MHADRFEEFFRAAKGGSLPFACQRRLAEISACRSLLIDVPAGCGAFADAGRYRGDGLPWPVEPRQVLLNPAIL